MQPPDEILTNRLRLRLPTASDSEAVFDYASDPHVTEYLSFPTNTHVDEAIGFLQVLADARTSGSAFSWAICLRDDDQLLGMIEARPDGHRVELGYVMRRSAWGNGYMTESVVALTDWLLAEDSVYRVWAWADTANSGSQRVLEKAGFSREGLLHRWGAHTNVSHEPSDVFSYAKWR